jgi:GGDEF domain-containing protein
LQTILHEKDEAAHLLADEISAHTLLQKRLEQDATTDPLTGLCNRRSFST